MKGKFNLLVFSLLCVLLTSCGGSSSSSSATSNNDNTPETTVDSVLEGVIAANVDGIFIYAQKGSEQGEYHQKGVKNKTTLAPASSDDLFKIASISKLFIAVAATKAHHQSLLSIDDTLASWLPELSGQIQNADSITIRHMLQHRSGIPDFDSQPGFDWQDPHTDIDETLAFILGKPADFTPNSRNEYSNSNYLLIGKILDKALGYQHSEFIDENILQPLAMHNTYYQLAEADMSRMISGYWLGVNRTEQAYVIPGGSMVASIEDTATFIRALNTGDLLSSEERQTYQDVYSFGHSGWVPGYQSIARYNSARDLVLIQFVNTTGQGSEDVVSDAYEDLLRLF